MHAHTSTRVRVKRCLRAFPRLSFRDISAPLSKPIFEISIRLASLPLLALVNNCHRCCVRIEMGLEARGIAQLSWLYRSFENRDEGEKLWKIASFLCALLRSSVRVTLRNLHVSMNKKKMSDKSKRNFLQRENLIFKLNDSSIR